MRERVNIFWFRRDLRLHDNAGLYHALKSGKPVLPLFIFDKNILDKLSCRDDKRVQFIHHTLLGLGEQLKALGSGILVRYGFPNEIWADLQREYEIAEVSCNRDYEPYAIRRDNEVADLLRKAEIPFKTYKDQCIFEYNEILKPDGKPYTVFTPYYRKWRAKLDDFYLGAYTCEQYYEAFYKFNMTDFPSLAQMRFEAGKVSYPPKEISIELIKQYGGKRDFPALNGTSRLSIHLRFGTIPIREKAALARQYSDKWLAELAWRDFYMQILAHFPHVEHSAFKPAYDRVVWRNDEKEFGAWCGGKTGYPIVDAGMRELNTTGFMHNRVRMIVASFLCKHLLIDWRWGEAYFAGKLLDYELASNNGGWQWAAGSGVDAAPYFRIFNPALQEQKFDPHQQYIRKWIPELGTDKYPAPIVEHAFARERCLDTYKKALSR